MGSELSESAICTGALIGEKYRLLRLLGSGAFGNVYEAEHAVVGRRYAVKVLHRTRGATRSRQRFAREARVLTRLEHENIVGLMDAGEDGAFGEYLVLEFIRGSTLRTELTAAPLQGAPRLVDIVRQLARGLAHAHAAGVIHRDLKPENVMLTSHADGRLLVKILDFGIARLCDAEEEQLTASGAALGTAAYMAPEQARGERNIDERADVYALGVMAYEALSGVRPFEGASYNETLFRILTQPHLPLCTLRPELSPALCAAIERALCKDRTERFATAEDFAQALESADIAADDATVELEPGERPAQPIASEPPAPMASSSVTPPPAASARAAAVRVSPPVMVSFAAATLLAIGLAWSVRGSVSSFGAPREPALAVSLDTATLNEAPLAASDSRRGEPPTPTPDAAASALGSSPSASAAPRSSAVPPSASASAQPRGPRTVIPQRARLPGSPYRDRGF